MPDSMDKLHGDVDFARLAAHSWNMFRYVGDYLHLFGIIILITTIAKNRSVAGISRSTQILYFLVFITRYLDLLDHSQTAYLVVFKLTYISTACIILACFHGMNQTYQRVNDTVSLTFILAPCFIGAFFLTDQYSILEILWTFSEFVEGFAMVPQYVFCYREKGARTSGAGLYVITLGSYRVFYALNWIYKKVTMPHYSDIQSWIGGIIEILFFIDFLNYRFRGSSMLRTAVLQVDEKINDISEQVELKVLGSSSRMETTEGGEVRRRRKVGDDDGMQMADV
jgi:ER lumen protein retaining receptor